ncbi:DUF4153 domain-containing protein [Pseudonocardia lacus]|uniref:DUF4153 domain-containing protein n=1 Tax=Pseudonocardia lacus TaxID=2835865 RepID=UPI0020289E9D|nr:DUF4173 domain-containing protein [Pseudonocardia lacus]
MTTTLPPTPDAPVPRRLLAATALGGLGCALAIPTERPGIGWPVAVAVLAVAVLLVGANTPGGVRALMPGAARVETLTWAVAALALTAVAWVRAAEWLVALCLLTACVAAAMAVGGRLMVSVLRAVLSIPLGMLQAVPWLGRAVRRSYRTPGSGPDVRIALSVGVGLVLLLVFGTLLASADAVFAGLVDNLLPVIDEDAVSTAVVLFVLGAALVAGTALLLVAPPALTLAAPRPTRLRTLDWAVPVGLLVALFAVFVGVQFATLFGTEQYVQDTTGLTFAEYARSGFWQLLAVSALALGVILAGIRWAPATSDADRSTKRLLLGAMAVLCLVIVVSALRRMWLYQQAYGFTVLRLLVGACELWLGLAFLLALVAVLRLRPTGTVRPMVATAVGALVLLAVLDPERFVAAQNVARFEATGRLDAEYLSRLSADAVPALLALPDSPERTCVLARIAAGNTARGGDDWRTANLSRAAAEASVGHLAGLSDRASGGDPVFGGGRYLGPEEPGCSLS